VIFVIDIPASGIYGLDPSIFIMFMRYMNVLW